MPRDIPQRVFSVSVASVLEVPWQQLIDVLLFVPIDDGYEDAGQVAVRFDFVELAGLDE